MSLTITRRSAYQLRSMFRRAFGTRGPGPAGCFTAAADTLSVKARSADIAVEYTELGGGTPETLWLPFQILDDCEGRKDEPVHIEATGKRRVTAQWRDGSVPQIVQYDVSEPVDADKFPNLPENFTENLVGMFPKQRWRAVGRDRRHGKMDRIGAQFQRPGRWPLDFDRIAAMPDLRILENFLDRI